LAWLAKVVSLHGEEPTARREILIRLQNNGIATLVDYPIDKFV